MYAEKASFGERVGDWFRHVLSCCDREDEEETRPALQISGPTNFRREDISISGLDPDQQAFIRNKAISDAKHLYAHLQPLRSSPSGNFASPTSPKMPTYEEFTTPRSHNSIASTPASRVSTLERVKRHSRKISNSFTKGPMFAGAPAVYHQVGLENGDAKYEMRALMDPSETVVPLGKLSGESFSVGGSEIEDRESGKVVKF